jgi:hypothetical protein
MTSARRALSTASGYRSSVSMGHPWFHMPAIPKRRRPSPPGLAVPREGADRSSRAPKPRAGSAGVQILAHRRASGGRCSAPSRRWVMDDRIDAAHGEVEHRSIGERTHHLLAGPWRLPNRRVTARWLRRSEDTSPVTLGHMSTPEALIEDTCPATRSRFPQSRRTPALARPLLALACRARMR